MGFRVGTVPQEVLSRNRLRRPHRSKSSASPARPRTGRRFWRGCSGACRASSLWARSAT